MSKAAKSVFGVLASVATHPAVRVGVIALMAIDQAATKLRDQIVIKQAVAN